MPESHNASLLVTYYERFLRDQDVEGFRGNVSARYMEGTLIRLTESGEIQTRRAAVLALGLVGTFQANAAVGKISDLPVQHVAAAPASMLQGAQAMSKGAPGISGVLPVQRDLFPKI